MAGAAPIVSKVAPLKPSLGLPERVNEANMVTRATFKELQDLFKTTWNQIERSGMLLSTPRDFNIHERCKREQTDHMTKNYLNKGQPLNKPNIRRRSCYHHSDMLLKSLAHDDDVINGLTDASLTLTLTC